MTPRPRQIVLDAVHITSSAERSAFLLRECGDDEGLRRQVEQLLRAHGIDDGFLETPAAAMAETISSPAAIAATANESAGDLIGDFKLIERIGEGGMGSVWMAEQQRPVRRVVALKLIKAGMDTRAVLARFEAERQALALMDHPNIAKVLDAGQSAGRPYFVMELVKGTPITTYCDANHLTARQRLDLFVPVCHAIQHAHQKGVIHRDIKPSNVLVALYDDKPVPKVIDFGVAKAAGQPLTEMTLHTGYGAIIGTPEYMSPEQATFNQLDIDTRSDVYSLGVLLYELLTGTTPVDKTRLKQAALLEVLRVVREEEPQRPSVKLSTSTARATIAANRGSASAELSRQLQGELDWIVMKSLEKDRARRYETAAALGRDVDRYLRDELVEARPPSLGYRVGKLLRRHRGPVIAAAAVMVALVVGFIGTTAGMLRARAAERETSLARNVAVDNERKAVEGLNRNQGLRLVLQSELTRASDPGMALLLAIEGAARHPGLHASNALLAALHDNREARTLIGHANCVAGLSFSADGRRLLTGSLDGSMRIWDVQTGRQLMEFSDDIVRTTKTKDTTATLRFKPMYVAVCFSPDGDRVLATATDGRYRMWDIAGGKEISLLEVPDPRAPRPDLRPIAPASFSRDGRFILTGYGEARLWDGRTGTFVKSLGGHSERVNWAEFNADGTRVITASADGRARIVDVDSGKVIQTLDGPEKLEVVVARFSPDGRRALTVSDLGKVGPAKEPLCRLWDVETGKRISSHGSPRGVGEFPPLAFFTPDGSRLLTNDFWGDTGLHLSQSADGMPHANIPFERTNAVTAMSGDGRRLATSPLTTLTTTIDLRAPDTLQPIEQLRGHRGAVQAMAFSPDGQFLASADGAGVVRIWVVGGDAERRAGRWSRHRFLSASPDGKLIATATEDLKGVIVWDAATGGQRVRIPGQGFKEATFARFSPDGSRLFFGMRSHTNMSACVGEVATGKLVTVLPMGNDYFSYADLSPDGAYAATVTDWRHGRVWNLHTGKEQSSWELTDSDWHKGICVFSPDSRSLITCQARGAQLRDPATGREGPLLRGADPLGYVGGGAAFSADGRFILTWHHRSQDRDPAQIWDRAGQKVLTSLAGSDKGGGLVIYSAEFSPDGREVIASCSDNTARVWDAATGKQQWILGGHQFGVAAATFSADGKLVLTASE